MTQPAETSTHAPPRRDELLEGLRGDGARHEEAIRDLHAMLLRAARFEIGRRSTALAHVRGDDRADLALQAADDAFVAIMGKLHEFRGDSRFSTWVYKFALYEAAVRVRRRAWQHREVVLEPDAWLTVGDQAAGPAARYDRTELLDAIRALIDSALTARQREVLVALTIQGIPVDVLAERLGSTRGALYKSLHDARRTLRSHLAAAGYDLESISP
jgi:RNA polymerase sigma-70 factor (ECF subfamily)